MIRHTRESRNSVENADESNDGVDSSKGILNIFNKKILYCDVLGGQEDNEEEEEENGEKGEGEAEGYDSPLVFISVNPYSYVL